MDRPKYELSAHAATVIAERRIALQWLERVLLNPEQVEARTFDPETTSALGRIAENGDRVLRVVYNGKVDPPRIITAYFDRGLKGKL